jgi:hypothetical protein
MDFSYVRSAHEIAGEGLLKLHNVRLKAIRDMVLQLLTTVGSARQPDRCKRLLEAQGIGLQSACAGCHMKLRASGVPCEAQEPGERLHNVT